MKVLFDTSTLVAALVKPHPMHARAFQWLKRSRSHEFDMIISSHTLAELYAVLTSLPLSPRITPDMSWRLINENVIAAGSIIALSSSDYISVIRHLQNIGFSGGIIYDALILKAAVKSGATHLLTFNASDFKRIEMNSEIQIIEP
jgi:predicted nucleic acid-binding protein